MNLRKKKALVRGNVDFVFWYNIDKAILSFGYEIILFLSNQNVE